MTIDRFFCMTLPNALTYFTVLDIRSLMFYKRFFQAKKKSHLFFQLIFLDPYFTNFFKKST
jgi:hypothetical protein